MFDSEFLVYVAYNISSQNMLLLSVLVWVAEYMFFGSKMSDGH
jgi:hypothetical protein